MKPRLLVACERSGVVRDAFLDIGWDAVSCDLEPSVVGGPHYQGDVRDLLGEPWDLMIGHPPCTHLSNARNAWVRFLDPAKRTDAMAFVNLLWNVPIPRICLENPVGYLSTHWRKPDQYVQPFQFGHTVTKNTCLWLKNLPKIIRTTYIHLEQETKVDNIGGKNRAFRKAVTYKGIALAMAATWGRLHDKDYSSPAQ